MMDVSLFSFLHAKKDTAFWMTFLVMESSVLIDSPVWLVASHFLQFVFSL